MNNRNDNMGYVLWIILAIPVLWFALAFAQATSSAEGLAGILEVLSFLLSKPLAVQWSVNAPKCILIAAILYPMAVAYYITDQKDRRPGEEYGSATWGDVRSLNRKYRDKKTKNGNCIFTEHFSIGINNMYRHMRNLNALIIGGSGAGKTLFCILPNLLQAFCSYIILDPKGEILRAVGKLFEKLKIGISVIDLVNFRGHYNPFHYLRTQEDAVKLAHAIVFNTKSSDAASGSDPFWDNSSVLLISALIMYLMYQCPKEDQNFTTLMFMIQNCRIAEDVDMPNPIEILFRELEEEDPMHPAVLQYNSFNVASGKTLKSILATASANLYMFNSSRFAELTSRDEMFIPEIGEHKRAVFCIIPDNDDTFNFLITIFYTQVFDHLFRLADTKYGGKLPVHVRFLMDEFANVALPHNFKNIISVCRSRGISIVAVIQNMAQLKSRFKDGWETIIGNCDTLLYLGGNEYSTCEYISKLVGKMTERVISRSIGKGGHGSTSESHQHTSRDLISPDELRRMDNKKALLLVRGERPVIDNKYVLKKHPNFKYTPYGGAEPYIMPPDYIGKAAAFVTAEDLDDLNAGNIPQEVLDKYELIDMEDIA